ncbi:MAG: lamin tail domain-containing protein, partial [Calditrichales bacterium]
MKNAGRFIPIIILLFARTLCSQVTFSEIMFDVATNEYHDEFVELFNLSYKDTLTITGWTFSDSAGVDGLVPYRGGTKISPRSYAVILDGSYAVNSLTYEQIIPDTVTILTITDNSFGKNGLSNTVAESLSICDSSGNVLCRYRYSIGNPAGISDEKIDLDGDDSEVNWGNSLCEGGTPGWRNSLAPRLIDFGFEDSGMTLPVFSFTGDSIPVEIVLSMFGQQAPADSLLIQIFSCYEDDPDPAAADLLLFERWFPSGPLYFLTQLPPLATGRHRLTVRVHHPMDENRDNDQLTANLDIYCRDQSLHINEIKFLVPADEPEWIELVNTGTEGIPLRGWAVSDLTDTVRIDTAAYLGAGEFMVIAGDTLPDYYRTSSQNLLILRNFPVLNDAGDEISLIDPLGSWQERITYSRDWL